MVGKIVVSQHSTGGQFLEIFFFYVPAKLGVVFHENRLSNSVATKSWQIDRQATHNRYQSLLSPIGCQQAVCFFIG